MLYLTGYSDPLFLDKAPLGDTEAFLQKPCSIKALDDSVSRLVNGLDGVAQAARQVERCAVAGDMTPSNLHSPI